MLEAKVSGTDEKRVNVTVTAGAVGAWGIAALYNGIGKVGGAGTIIENHSTGIAPEDAVGRREGGAYVVHYAATGCRVTGEGAVDGRQGHSAIIILVEHGTAVLCSRIIEEQAVGHHR